MTQAPLYSIEPAQFQLQAGRAPRSPEFDDDYFHPRDGLAESRYVFLEGVGLAGLLAHWSKARDPLCLAETGFGTGLNFLATYQAWRARRAAGQTVPRLDYVSLEGRPLSLTQCQAAWQPWQSELALETHALSQVLPPPCPGFHLVTLEGGQIRLLLLYGQAEQVLPQADFQAQAWYLDGFTPARNAGLWSPAVFAQIARLSAPGARLATFSAARMVKDALAGAGADWQLRPGFQGKRNCLQAAFAGKLEPPASAWPERIRLVGAGIAGAAAALCLNQAGHPEIEVIEAEKTPASQASGNPAGLVEPRLSHALAPEIELQRLAFVHAVLAYQSQGAFMEPRGMLKIARDPASQDKMAKWLASGLLPPDWMADAGPGQLWFATSGAVCPPRVVRAWLSDLPLVTGRRWRPETNQPGPGEAVVLTSGAVSRLALSAEQNTALGAALCANKGQLVTRKTAERLARFVSKSGYLLDDGQQWIAGSSFQRFALDWQQRDALWQARAWANEDPQETQILRQRLADLQPGLEQLDWRFARAALRSVTRDRTPVLGRLPQAGSGAGWIFAGLGSRGLSLAPLLSHELRAELLGQMHVLPRRLRAILDPLRFLPAA